MVPVLSNSSSHFLCTSKGEGVVVPVLSYTSESNFCLEEQAPSLRQWSMMDTKLGRSAAVCGRMVYGVIDIFSKVYLVVKMIVTARTCCKRTADATMYSTWR